MYPGKCIRPGILLAIILLLTSTLYAQKLDSVIERERIQKYIDSFDNSINYQKGKVTIKDIAVLNVPDAYKFVPADKAQMILHDLWGNPKSPATLGMLVSADFSVGNGDSWAFIISYDESGYVKDEDADKINYDDLLKEMQNDEEESNKARAKEGYPPIHMRGWAAKPYYDKETKVLHWAKELEFGGEEPSTVLNYDVRVLGRKGVLSLNAVGSMGQLNDINGHIPVVLKMATFTEGNTYKDFNPSVDKVAAYTIGGLIAGKLIAKTGLFVLLLKNIKLIAIALFGGFAAFRKKIAGWFSRKKKDEEFAGEPVQKPWEVDSPGAEAQGEAQQQEVVAETEVVTDESKEGI